MYNNPFPSPTKTWHDKAYPAIAATRPELSAKGKSIFITGGGTGIGAETALQFATAGATNIALVGRREQPLLDTKAALEKKFPGLSVYTAPTDISKKDQVDRAVDGFLAKTGKKIDVLVSSAGLTGPLPPLHEVDGEAFLHAIHQNLAMSLWVAQAFANRAAVEKDPVVISVNSSAAHISFGPGFPAYSVAKMSVFRLWDTLTAAKPHMRVYHIQPGVVDTDMNKEAGGVAAMGFADDVNLPASFSVWLASPEARFLKGKFLWANWDVDELKAEAKEVEHGQKYNIGLGGWPFGSEWKFSATEGSADAWAK